MSKTKKIVLVVYMVIVVGLMAFAAINGAATGTAWSLLPPVLAIVLALITKEVYSSLGFGILIAALLATSFHPLQTMNTIIGGESVVDGEITRTGLIGAVSGTAGVFIFLIELGIIVALINKAGGSQAFGRWAAKHIKTRTGAMLATFVLGVLIFIDDYFNCLTVGSVMRPVTDGHKISRSKFAYLIDATAAPVCMIAPISSWAAAVSDYANQVKGFKGQGLQLFINAIPYNFYSILTFVFIICICVMSFDYGSMALHEYNAQYKDDLYTTGERVDKELENEAPNPNGKVIDLVLPVIVLIVVSVFALIYNGGFLDGSNKDCYFNFINSFANTDATVALPWAGIISLVFTVVYLILRKIVTFKESMEAAPKGFMAMVPPILILTFATTLKSITNQLGSDAFIQDLMKNAGGLMNFLPAIIFLVAVFLSFSTGTSWGTFGILIPIVLPIFTANPEMQIIGMSACLAGAVCGDHCSPISDTTIMSSAGAQCNHINHVSTQLPYALTVAGVSFVSYIIAGFVQSWFIALPIAIVLMVGTLVVIKFIKKNAKVAESQGK
ncbi:MAG: Na+/H+ antiporter NhaC family protein [Ruminococcus sp.]|nr:Na+/H+ antiporter NhaC family protein [Ruminococcus sp.]